jgi:hypothetical protein
MSCSVKSQFTAKKQVVIPTWITFGLVALTQAAAFFLHRPVQKEGKRI